MYSPNGQPPAGAHGPNPGHLPPLSSPPQWGKLPATAGIPSSNSQVTSSTTAALMSNNGPASSTADFAITADQLGNVVNFDERANTEQTKLLNAKYGGVDGLAYFLRTHLETGLEVTDPATMDAVDAVPRQEAFGVNLVAPPPSQTILEMILENIKEDPIIKILILGAIVTLIIGGIQGDGWIEGIAILSAVSIVLTVTAGNDYSKDKKFKRLLLLQSDKKTKVIRGGRKDQISSWDVMVGDLVELVIGDEIPADGVLVRGNRLVIDESPLTGESIPVKKSAKSPFLFSGCQACEGTGIMLVTAVGARSSGGKIQALLSEAQGQETVLQTKLRGMALSIGKMGFMAGITTFLVLTIRFIIDSVARYPQGGFPSSDLIRLLRFFNTSVTIVVVCVPEGLPLAVTISLAFSMFKMIKDRCFVRHLEASETMGEATAICTDKTGTLTENRMTVVKTLIARKVIHGEGSGEPDAIPLSASLFSDAIRDVLMEAVCINSTCFIKYKPNDPLPMFVGSATEGALLVMAQKLGYDYDKVRKQTRKVENGEYLFTSDRKRMATLCEPRAALVPGTSPPLFRLYVKGASEIILGLCQQQVNTDGTVVPLGGEDREHLFGVIRSWAGEGLRTLALAYRDFDRPLTRAERDDPEHDLVFLGLVGIKDPVRAKVPDAVRVCQEAGIIVRMVTGDNLLTACKIARECSILNDHGIAMEGPIFRELSIPEKKAVIPKLQVLARSSPADKHTLVSLLKEMGEVVAVTGDGTNDAPALKEADVGFAMGISGTQISMNASDIILLDDNFVSIVQSIKWGRNVLNAVRKFLQFQLSVNVVAICTTIIGAIANDESPLTPVQLLWVNLIMDTFGALALASDVPDPKLLKQKPHRRHDPILTRPMAAYVFTCAFYQVVVLMMILFRAEELLYPSFGAAGRGITGRRWTMTILFTTFVLMQVINKLLARQLNFELNFLRGTTKNPLFPLMIFCIIFIQTLIVQFAGDFVRTVPLTGSEWGLCIAFALGMIPYQTAIRICVLLYRLHKFGPDYQVHSEHAEHSHPLTEASLPQQPSGKSSANGKYLPEQQPLKQATILKSSSVARSPADLGE